MQTQNTQSVSDLTQAYVCGAVELENVREQLQTDCDREDLVNRWIRTGDLEAPPGFEPVMEILQS